MFKQDRCKVNYVINVKLILSNSRNWRYMRLKIPIFININKEQACLVFDTAYFCDIIYFTFILWSYIHEQQQNHLFKKFWNLKSLSRQSDRSAIPSTRFFRCSRFITSQIRNASSSVNRWMVNNKSNPAIWIFSSSLLPNTECFQKRWFNWIISEETGPKISTQTNQRNYRLYQKNFNRITVRNTNHINNHYKDEVRHYYSSAQCRARTFTGEKGNKKNSPLIPGDAIERYERLRKAILELNDNLNNDLIAFLRKGFAAWVSSEFKQEIIAYKEPILKLTILEKEQRHIVHVLANMILHNQQQEIRL